MNSIPSQKSFLPWSNQVSLLLLVLVLFVLVGTHLLSYMSGILGALTIYTLVRGQMKCLVEKKKWNTSWAATILILEVVFFFLIPLTGGVLLMIDVLSFIHIDIGQIALRVDSWTNHIEEITGFKILDIFDQQTVEKLSSTATSIVQYLASNTYSIAVNCFVILFLLFFMLKGYRSFEQAIRELLPFDEKNKQIVAHETLIIVKSNAIGIPLLAIVQGVFAYIGYSIFGVQGAVIYSILTAISTVIPVIGTMVVWIPLSISFALSGDWGSAIGLGIYGFLIIGGVDNVVRFIMQKQLADTHPLITVFGVIIGISIFGFWGIIFGPLLLSLLVLLVNIYRHDYIPGSEAKLGIPNDKTRGRLLRFRQKQNK